LVGRRANSTTTRAQSAMAQQWQALDARIDALRRDQRRQAQRLQQADATNRCCATNCSASASARRCWRTACAGSPIRRCTARRRCDWTKWSSCSAKGEQRLRLAGDLDGARRAYAIAGGLLQGVDDPVYLNLRQALVQERAALDALGADPRSLAEGKLEAFAATLAAPARLPQAGHEALPWWRRAFEKHRAGAAVRDHGRERRR
jgi:uroporphyrin-3 C-methyltransferase